MSDLSWLNPTPHAIAVYASRPLSPVATQHSLPSGRYPLLGPDFHRLDRTSLRLAHSLNHLVGEREQLGGQVEAESAWCSRPTALTTAASAAGISPSRRSPGRSASRCRRCHRGKAAYRFPLSSNV